MQIQKYYEEGRQEIERGEIQFVEKIVTSSNRRSMQTSFSRSKHVPVELLEQLDVPEQFLERNEEGLPL